MPTKDREGALLTDKNEPSVIENKRIIETAFNLLQNGLDFLSQNKFEGLHNIAAIPKPSAFPNWLNEPWIEPLVNDLITVLRSAKLVKLGIGLIAPKDARIPCINDQDFQTLWEISTLAYPSDTPPQVEAMTWRDTIAGWARHVYPTDNDATKFDESVTIEKLASMVDVLSSAEKLQSILKTSTWSVFLNKLLNLILETRKDALLNEFHILPDQEGNFRTKDELSKDPGISEELKDIITLLGRKVRGELLAKDIKLASIQSRSEEEIKLDALDRIKEQAKNDSGSKNFQDANVRLLKWLVNTSKTAEIAEAYPLVTRVKDLGENDFIRFSSDESQFLPSAKTWKVNDAPHIEVFPPRAILSDLYEVMTLAEWEFLSKAGLVLLGTISKESTQLDDKEIRMLTVDEIGEEDKIHHKSKGSVDCSNIPFLEEKDWGIIDRVRGSKTMASKFLTFILLAAIQEDSAWRDEISIDCECGSQHKLYASLWLKTLRSRQWIPVAGGKEEKPSSENLAPFFADPALMSVLRSDVNVSHFLSVLGVNVSVLMTANKSKTDQMEIDRAFSRFLAATDVDPAQLSKLAEAYSDQGLRTKLLEAIEEKELVGVNRRIGELVEKTIRESLRVKLANQPFKVEKVTVGSDVRITVLSTDVETMNDYVDESGNEVFVRISKGNDEHLIEIKSTRSLDVRITIPQARQAHKTGQNFSLCAVHVPPNIADIPDEQAEHIVLQSARFVSAIGEKLGNILNDVNAFKADEKALHSQGSQGMRVDVLSESKIRINVDSSVYENGLTFDAFIAMITGLAKTESNSPTMQILAG